MSNERAAYVALALTPGIGITRLRNLIAACDTPLGAFSAPHAFLRAVPGMTVAAATAIRERSVSDGEKALADAGRFGATALIPGDPHFPDALRDIPDAPPLLFATGSLELLRRPAVAIVGSRNHTRYGAEACRMIAAGAARAGLVVVSGMARGIDALAHEAALAHGSSIGVLGNGIGVIYPAANRALYQRMTEVGLLLSEFPPGERPNAGSFPRRNRLISGLARVTVVVEAAGDSGALITAGTALNQGRDVMAVPGPITSSTSDGTNALIRDGAEPLLTLRDLLAHYPEAHPLPDPEFTASGPTLPPDLAPGLHAVAQPMLSGPLQLDAIAAATALPISDVLAALCELELLGVVSQHPGQVFALSVER